MGCDTYNIGLYKGDGKWGECQIYFSESDDGSPCICTFPYNNKVSGKKINGEEVISLALLGVAVKLAHDGDLEEGYNYIPNCIPDWILKEIKKHILT